MEHLMAVIVEALYQQSREIDRQDKELATLEKSMSDFMEAYKDDLAELAEKPGD